METLEIHGDFLNALMRMAGSRIHKKVNAARLANALERAYPDIPDGEIPASLDLTPFEFYAGKRRKMVKDFIKLIRKYGDFRVEFFTKPPYEPWFRLYFEDLDNEQQ